MSIPKSTLNWPLFVKDLPTLDVPDSQQILQKFGIPKPLLPEKSQITRYRQMFRASTARYVRSPFIQNAMAKAQEERKWTEADEHIPVDGDASICARIYQPESATERLRPVILVVHGGGFCMGDLDTEVFLCRYLCATLDIVMVSVGYRLYPEVPFPVPIRDVYHAINWVRWKIFNLWSSF